MSLLGSVKMLIVSYVLNHFFVIFLQSAVTRAEQAKIECNLDESTNKKLNNKTPNKSIKAPIRFESSRYN